MSRKIKIVITNPEIYQIANGVMQDGVCIMLELRYAVSSIVTTAHKDRDVRDPEKRSDIGLVLYIQSCVVCSKT